MWRAFDATGRLQFPDFVETSIRIAPMNAVRVFGGALYITGTFIGIYNIYRTWANRPSMYAESEVNIPVPTWRRSSAMGELGLHPAAEPGAHWHRRWEGLPLVFTVLVAVAVIVASLFEILPTFLIGDNVPRIASVRPYRPLELYGRDIYIREGCYNCHSQMIRPFVDETVRYGEYSKPGEFVYDHPFQWGSRRIGPDLHREGGKRGHVWHWHHFRDPRATSKGSVMPAYPHLYSERISWGDIQSRVNAMAMLGTPYSKDALDDAADVARQQAEQIASELAAQGGPSGVADREIIALIAYVQRLGTDIKPPAPATPSIVEGAK